MFEANFQKIRLLKKYELWLNLIFTSADFFVEKLTNLEVNKSGTNKVGRFDKIGTRKEICQNKTIL